MRYEMGSTQSPRRTRPDSTNPPIGAMTLPVSSPPFLERDLECHLCELDHKQLACDERRVGFDETREESRA